MTRKLYVAIYHCPFTNEVSFIGSFSELEMARCAIASNMNLHNEQVLDFSRQKMSDLHVRPQSGYKIYVSNLDDVDNIQQLTE